MTAFVERADAIEPFWQRLPAIFAYGLKPASLATMGAIALGMAVSAMLPGIVGLLGILVVMSTLFKLCFEVLQTTAMGRMEPPESALGRIGGSIFWNSCWR